VKLPEMIHSGHWTGGHCQGIAVDTQRRYMYYSFTTMLVKTDMEGNLVGSVTGLQGHLGCLAFCNEDGRVYGSLEYKMDAIGKGILKNIGVEKELDERFYIVVFDAEKIDRPGMDACADGVMTAVHLQEVLDDYCAVVTNQGREVQHRHGCSGIDGVTFAPVPGEDPEKRYLMVAYGIYGDTERTDNDYQVLLCYDTSDWKRYMQPLRQDCMHRSGPEKPLRKLFVPTGNTTYGVQNLEYDPFTGDLLMAVYPGRKPQYPNHRLFAADGTKAPVMQVLEGVEPPVEGEVLALRGEGWDYPWGSTGMIALGGGSWYMSHEGRNEKGHFTDVQLCRWDGVHPITP